MLSNLKALKSALLLSLLIQLSACQHDKPSIPKNDKLKNILTRLQSKGAWNEAIDLATIQLYLSESEEDKISYLNVIGQSNRMKEAYKKSEVAFKQVIGFDPSVYPDVGKAYYGIGDLSYLKWSYFKQEDQLDSAVIYVNKAKRIAEQSNNYPLLSQCLYRLGTIDQIQNNNETAMEKFSEAYRLASVANDTAGIIRNSTHKAVGFKRSENFDSAAYYFRNSLKLASASNNYYSESHSLGNLGSFYQDQKELDSALKYYGRALFLSKKLDHSLLQCKSNLLLGRYYKSIGRNNEALKYLSNGLAIAEQIGYKNFIGYFETALADIQNYE